MKYSRLARKPRLALVEESGRLSPDLADIVPELSDEPPPGEKDGHRWLTSLLIVVSAYGAPLAWWLMPTSPSGANAPPPAAMVVEIAPAPVAPAAQPDMPPGPEQVDSQPTSEPEPEPEPEPEIPPPPPEVKPEVAVNPRPEPPPPEEPEATPREEKPQSVASAPPAAALEDIEAAAPNQGVSVPAFNADAIPSWQNSLMLKLNEAKRYPNRARRYRQEGIAYLHFTMNREGQVLAKSIERSAGYALLDDETLALIDRAQPLPKPPAEIQGEVLKFVVPVEFFLRP